MELPARILVVDDKVYLSNIVSQFLGNTYEVSTVENGLDALKWLQDSESVDLIITDLEMPVMDGIEFLSHLKHSGLFSDIPVLVLSCRDASSDRIRCLRMGANDYMVKPFNPEELQLRVQKLVLQYK